MAHQQAAQKQVFFVRHAQSDWNRGEDRWFLSLRMLTRKDHVLSAKGRLQAQGLERRLQQAGTKAEKAMLMPDAVISSPLTRAVQTAVLGLRPLLGKCTLRLIPDIRERRNWGGRDSSGTRVGNDVIDKVKQHLPSEYSEIVDRVDCSDVETQWWSDAKEDSAAMQERMNSFLDQLQAMPEKCIIIVGHSHFFRDLFHHFASKDMETVGALPDDFCTKKLSNCGVAAVNFDFKRRGAGTGCITKAELIYGSSLV